MVRKIIHIDMDCFFVAVEVLAEPKLKGLPVAVGGKAHERGVISSASYEARALGVRSAISTAEALRRCPGLIIVSPNFSKYKEASACIYQIFSEYSSIVEPVSVDEAYLDVSDTSPYKTATLLAKAIREHIFRDTGLTASAGIAPNPFLAKVASDWRKPNGQFTITPEMVDEFVKNLALRKVPGVGKVTEEKLKSLGFITCGDLRSLSMPEMNFRFGKWGHRLYHLCRGQDDRLIGLKRDRKSVSIEHTFSHDLSHQNDCLKQLPPLMKELERRLMKHGTERIRSLFVKVKFADFTVTTVDDAHLNRIDLVNFQTLLTKAMARQKKAIRLIGVGVRLNENNSPTQLELFHPKAS